MKLNTLLLAVSLMAINKQINRDTAIKLLRGGWDIFEFNENHILIFDNQIFIIKTCKINIDIILCFRRLLGYCILHEYY